MLFGEILTFSGIAFMLILLSVYFSKPTVVTLKTRFFRILLILIALYIVSELLSIIKTNDFKRIIIAVDSDPSGSHICTLWRGIHAQGLPDP